MARGGTGGCLGDCVSSPGPDGELGGAPSPTSSITLVFGQNETVLPTLKEHFMREKGWQVDEAMSRR